MPNNEKGSWYMFNNQSLSQVFDQLGSMYNVEINYDKKDIYNKYFIGTFNKSDSLEHILNEIAVLNHLKVEAKSDGFVITR